MINDKEKQIEEIAKDICSKYGMCTCNNRDGRCGTPRQHARIIYELGYRKIPEDSVVVSKTVLKGELRNLEMQARKETAREVLTHIKQAILDYFKVNSDEELDSLSLLDSTMTYDVVINKVDELAKSYHVEITE